MEGLEARLELRAYFTRGRERGGAQPGSQAVAWREGTLAPASPTPRWNFATLAESRRISPDLATSFAEQPVPPDGREVEGDGPRLLSGHISGELSGPLERQMEMAGPAMAGGMSASRVAP